MFILWIMECTFIEKIGLLISAAAICALQLSLCFKRTNMGVRLLPIGFFITLIIVSGVMSFIHKGHAVEYIFLNYYLLYLILFCGLGWGIWAVMRYVKSKSN